MIRRKRLLTVLGFGALFVSIFGTSFCAGQNCASNIVDQTELCTDGKGCHNIWFYPELEYEGPDYIYTCEPFDCCGQLVTECTLQLPS